MRKLFLSLLLLTCGLTMSAQTTTADEDSQYATEMLKPGTMAPNFVIANSEQGNGLSLDSFRGKYVVLEFWASWCPDCRREIPAVKALWEKYQSKGVQFIGVSFDTDKAAWKKCVEQNGMGWLQHSELKKWKRDTKIDRDYQVRWIPSFYVIDPQGKIILSTVMTEKVAALLAKVTATGKCGNSCGTGSTGAASKACGASCGCGCHSGAKSCSCGSESSSSSKACGSSCKTAGSCGNKSCGSKSSCCKTTPAAKTCGTQSGCGCGAKSCGVNGKCSCGSKCGSHSK